MLQIDGVYEWEENKSMRILLNPHMLMILLIILKHIMSIVSFPQQSTSSRLLEQLNQNGPQRYPIATPFINTL